MQQNVPSAKYLSVNFWNSNWPPSAALWVVNETPSDSELYHFLELCPGETKVHHNWTYKYTCKNHTSCSKSVNKPSTSCVRTACPKLSTGMEEAVNNCNNLVDIIRLIARLFQQVRYSHDITILLQSCVVNLATFLLYHDCIRLVGTTL